MPFSAVVSHGKICLFDVIASNQINRRTCIVISDAWCGPVSSCPVSEGENVTLGCYVQYDWLSYWLHYNPVVSINASIQYLQDPSSLVEPPPPSFGTRPPQPEVLKTTYTMHNLQAGDTITATCRIGFDFDLATAYSLRNVYANNSLEYKCSVNVPVRCEYCRFLPHVAFAKCTDCLNVAVITKPPKCNFCFFF